MEQKIENERVKEIEAAFIKYLELYLAKRNFAETIALFSKANDISVIGTGEDEVSYTHKGSEALFVRDMNDVATKIEYEIFEQSIKSPEQNIGIVCCQLNLKATAKDQKFKLNRLRLTLIFIKEDSKWVIYHLHISFPTDTHQKGEAYPIKELERRNIVLQRLVERKTKELQEKNKELQKRLEEIKVLKGLLTICAYCKKVRIDEGYWKQIESYISENSELIFSHGICPECWKKLQTDDLDKEK